VTSSLAVFEAEIRVKTARLIKSRLKTRKNRKYQSINQSKHISIAPYVASESEAHIKYGNKRHFYIKLHLKDCFGKEFTTCSGELMPEEALTSFTISDAYH